MAKPKLKVAKAPQILKLDLGCGMNKREGFIGVDSRQYDGKVDVVCDLTKKWQWADDSVDEVNASHFVEHLDATERIHFVNELYRVLRAGAKCTITTPNWASNRAYGDLTHKWPPISEMWFFYLSKEWRRTQAPHNDFYTCDFDCAGGYSLHPSLVSRNTEYQQHAITFWKEAGQDIITTLTKRV